MGNLSRKAITDFYFSAARFTKDTYDSAISECAFLIHTKNVNILNNNIVLNYIIRYVISYLIDINIISNCAIVNRRIINAGMFYNTVKDYILFVENT